MTAAVPKVGKLSRLIDVASVALLGTGALLYLRAYTGMREIRSRDGEPFKAGTTEIFGGLREYARLHRMSNIALGLVAIGIIVAVGANLHARRVRAAAPITPST